MVTIELDIACRKRCLIVTSSLFGLKELYTLMPAAYITPVARVLLGLKAVTDIMIEIRDRKKDIFGFAFSCSRISVNGSEEMILNELHRQKILIYVLPSQFLSTTSSFTPRIIPSAYKA